MTTALVLLIDWILALLFFGILGATFKAIDRLLENRKLSLLTRLHVLKAVIVLMAHARQRLWGMLGAHVGINIAYVYGLFTPSAEQTVIYVVSSLMALQVLFTWKQWRNLHIISSFGESKPVI